MKIAGLSEHLNSMGFDDIEIEINRDENLINHLKIYYREKNPLNLLINLRVSESRFVPDKRFFEEETNIPPLDMVVIEWLSAQNPLKIFASEKPQLPGQNKPGLGSLNYMMNIMYIVEKELLKDGFMDIPNHFHGAVMYSRKFRFFNPSHEAVLKAILRDLRQYSLADLSWGLITKTITDKATGEPQVYDPSEQVFPVSRFMKDYFKSKKYKAKFRQVYKNKQYVFDYDKMIRLREEILQKTRIEDI